jgi:hypothetical protein
MVSKDILQRSLRDLFVIGIVHSSEFHSEEYVFYGDFNKE